MVESRSGFSYCTPGTEHRWVLLVLSLAFGVVAIVTMQMFERFVRVKLVCPPGLRIQTFLQIATPLATLLGTLACIYEASLEFGSLINCRTSVPLAFSLHALSKWITFLVHLYFGARLFLIWTSQWRIQFFFTIIHIGLLTQDILALLIRQHLLAFQFLILCSFYCPEVKKVLSKLVDFLPKYRYLLTLIGEIWLITFILAGFLKAAEEWNTNEGVHPDFAGFPTPMKSDFAYLYWIIITVSTVGFGDITPSTTAGRAILIMGIVFFLTWFSIRIAHLMEHFEYMRGILTNKDVLGISGRPCHHLLLGCEVEQQLKMFLKHFPKRDRCDLLVCVSSPNSELTAMAKHLTIKVVQGFDPLDIIKNSSFFSGSLDDSIWLLYNPQSHEDPETMDDYTVTLVQRIKETSCEARLFVKVTDVKKQSLIHQVNGWRGDNGADVCIASQLLDAHLLVYSAHSRLIAALIAIASTKKLLIEDDPHSYSDEEVSHAALSEYFGNGCILVGVIGFKGETLLPSMINHESSRIVLETNLGKKWGKPKLDPLIRFTPIRSNVSVVGGNACIQDALLKHPFPETKEQIPKFRIFASELESQMQSYYVLLYNKDCQHDDFLISTMEHRYEACLPKECVCGTFDNSYLSAAMLTMAYHDPILYDVWIEVIEGDHLAVDINQEDCTYGNLFKAMVERHNKIPLGVEITQQMTDGHSIRVPKLNPSPNLQIQKDDLVVYLHS